MPRALVSQSKKAIIIEEPDGTVTRILPHYRGDWMIEQTRPGEPKVLLTTYSDSGAKPFVHLLKFLHLTKARIPPIPKPEQRTSEQMYDRYRFASYDFLHPFPLSFATDLNPKGGVHGATSHWVRDGREPRLEFRQENGEAISISVPLAQQLVRIMPQIAGENTGPFRLARAALIRAVRENTFDSMAPSKLEQRGRQRMFTFYRKAIKEAWRKRTPTFKKPTRESLRRFHA